MHNSILELRRVIDTAGAQGYFVDAGLQAHDIAQQCTKSFNDSRAIAAFILASIFREMSETDYPIPQGDNKPAWHDFYSAISDVMSELEQPAPSNNIIKNCTNLIKIAELWFDC